jgi:L-ribulose-5-phosphate 3-epimerase
MRKQTPEQLALCSWSLRAQSPAELVRHIQPTGVTKVQLHLNPLRDRAKIWGAAPQVLRDAGIAVVSGMFNTVDEDYSTLESIRRTGGVVPDETWERNWAIVCDVAKLAADLGLRDVSTHAGFLPHDPNDPSFDKLVDRIKRIAERFSQHGLHLLFETGQETAETLAYFLDALHDEGVTNVAVNFDPANMILYDKGDPVLALKHLMPSVRQVHLKDAVRTQTPGTWGNEVVVGEGQVPWPAFVDVLEQSDFAGHLVIEREAGGERVNDIQKAVKFISKIIC